MAYLLTFSQRACSPIAQLVEQVAVNHWVAGSSPAWGANLKPRSDKRCGVFFCCVPMIPTKFFMGFQWRHVSIPKHHFCSFFISNGWKNWAYLTKKEN